MAWRTRLPIPIKKLLITPYIKFQYYINKTQRLCVEDICAKFPYSDYDTIKQVYEFESEVLKYALENTKADDIIYDIGADRGLYTCILGNKLDRGQVISFEPNPVTVLRLKQIVEFNSIPSIVLPFALGEKPRTATIERYRLVDSSNGDIEIKKGDEIVKEEDIPYPDMIKIDTEGMELEVLKGLKQVFEESPPSRILCEIHPDSSIPTGMSEAEIDELYEWLDNRYASIEVLGEENGQTYIWAEQQEDL